MQATPILIYAELLSNIQQISILVSLDTPCDLSTHVRFSDDARQIILFHRGKRHTLELPCQSCPSFKLQRPVVGSTGHSWRLPLAAQTQPKVRENVLNFDVPWSAKIMNEATEISCYCCGGIVVKKECITAWKDLPSEDWAEMMDLWHCHKPCDAETSHTQDKDTKDIVSDNDNSQHTMTERGYGANTKFAAQPGIGFVDITTFLFDAKDCVGILIQQNNSPHATLRIVKCAKCQSELGYYNTSLTGLQIWKWKLRIRTQSVHPAPFLIAQEPITHPSAHRGIVYPAPIILAAAISAKMASRLVSKFLLSMHPSSAPSRFLYLWIFGASLRFSCSLLPTRSTKLPFNGYPALKVFWKELSHGEASPLRDSAGIEELFIPHDVLFEMQEVLTKSANLLPPSSRKFQDWKIGLLERYEE